ncbi:MAG: glycosyltransferase [Agathobacter sp.]|nr:glycosyltransferase [Agathobacter sp.]
MKLSIILPVYNVEKYIEKCISSIVEQMWREDELIIIDDGSTDASGRICDDYATRYNNVWVYHIENAGVSNARNVGIEYATGQYVWFVDSDDYISTNAVRVIKEALESEAETDMLLFDATVVNEEEETLSDIKVNHMDEGITEDNIISQMVFQNTSLWNRIYRMDIIKNVGLGFDKGISIAEDMVFNFKYLLECSRIKYRKECLYYYVIHENSAMSGAGKNKDVESALDVLFQYYTRKNKYEMYKEELEYIAVYHYFIVTSVRIIRNSTNFEECRRIKEWFEAKGLHISLKNVYVKRMNLKHKLVLVLLKMKMYRLVKFLFEKK